MHMNKICIKCDVHLFLCPRLSGEYPFQGNNDAETLALVTAASYEFDEESFEDISEHAKDFIRSLLKKDRRCAKTTPKDHSICHCARVLLTEILSCALFDAADNVTSE